MLSGWFLRNVRKEDLRIFVESYKKAYEELKDYKYWKDEDIKNYFKWLYKRDQNGFFIAESEDGEFLGCIASDSNWINTEGEIVIEIHELFVSPKYRNMKIGMNLVKRSIDYGIERGRRKAELWVGLTNYRAINFYKSLEFVEVDVWGKWLRMAKLLKP